MYDLLNGEQVKLFKWYHFEPNPVIPHHYICAHGGNMESFKTGDTIPYLTEQPYGTTFLILDPNPSLEENNRFHWTENQAPFLLHWIENQILKHTIVYAPTGEINPQHIIWKDDNVICQEILQLLQKDIPVFDTDGNHRIHVKNLDDIITYVNANKNTENWVNEQLTAYRKLTNNYLKEVRILNQFHPNTKEFQTQMKAVETAELLRKAEYHRQQPGISAIRMIFNDHWHEPVTAYPYMHLLSQWLNALHLIVNDKNDVTDILNEYRKRFQETFPDFTEKDISFYKSYLTQVCHDPYPDSADSDFNLIFHP